MEEGKIEEKELTEEEKEKQERKEMNNFHMWMPGGAYRRSMEESGAEGKKVITEAVDKIIIEENLDTDKWKEDYMAFYNTQDKLIKKLRRGEKLSKEEESEFNKLEELDKSLEDRAYLIYKRMLETGFNKGDITG